MSEMSVQDIVKNSDEMKRYKKDWKRIYIALSYAVQTNKYRIVRAGDTLFVIKILEPHVAEVATLNAEKSFKQYVRNIKEFLQAMEISGYKEVHATDVNIQMVNLMKHAGFNVDATLMPSGTYSVVGTKKGGA